MSGLRITPLRVLLILLLVPLFYFLRSDSSPDGSPPALSFRPFGIAAPNWFSHHSDQEDLLGPPDDPVNPAHPERPLAAIPADPTPSAPAPPPPSINISHPGLRKRLETLLTRPVLSSARAITTNSRACTPATHNRLVDPQQLVEQSAWWGSVGEDDVRDRRQRMVRWLEELELSRIDLVAPELGYGEQRRGIVLTAGSGDALSRALTAIRLLRSYHASNLPIELFSFPGELPEALLPTLRSLQVTPRELTSQSKVPGAKTNAHVKALAVLLSEFDEVLSIDSDLLILREPSYLFEDEVFQQHGAAFWPDIYKDHPENPIWRLLGRTCDPTEWQMDSGAFLISKSGNRGLNLAAVHLAAHMQAEHDFWFRVSGGDKNTFRYAFWALGLEYTAAPRWLSALGYNDDKAGGRFCGLSTVQYDLSHPPSTLPSTPPSPLFIHATLLRQSGPLTASLAFSVLKRPSPDTPASSPALDRAHYFLYPSARGGDCLELELASDGGGAGAGAEDDEEEEEELGAEELRVTLVQERWEQVEQGTYAGFALAWEEEGGKIGAVGG